MLRSFRFARVVVPIALIAALLPATPSSAGRLEDTKREIRATRAKLAVAVRTDHELLAVLNEITARLSRERGLLSTAQLKLTRIDIAIRSEENRLDALDRSLASRRRIINGRAAELYMMGPVNTLETVTGTKSVEEFIGRAGAIESVAAFDRRAVQDVETIKYEATLTRRALAGQRVSASEIRNEIADRVELVSGIASVRREAHQRAAGRVSALRAELAAEQREQARVLALIRSRGSVYTGGSGRQGFAWPIRGNITSPYGPRWGGFHSGIDIDCRTGNGIGAAKAGKVIEAGWGGGYGNMVIVDHGGGYSTLYGHMSRIYVGNGSSVGQHEKVGACGSTGNSTGDHLHFEVRINGEHVNPRPYLP